MTGVSLIEYPFIIVNPEPDPVSLDHSLITASSDFDNLAPRIAHDPIRHGPLPPPDHYHAMVDVSPGVTDCRWRREVDQNSIGSPTRRAGPVEVGTNRHWTSG